MPRNFQSDDDDNDESFTNKRSSRKTATSESHLPLISRDEDLTSTPSKATTTADTVATSWHRNFMPRRERSSFHHHDDSSMEGESDDEGNDDDDELDPFASLRDLLEKQALSSKSSDGTDQGGQLPFVETRKPEENNFPSAGLREEENKVSQQNDSKGASLRCETGFANRSLSTHPSLTHSARLQTEEKTTKALERVKRKERPSAHWLKMRELGGGTRMPASSEKPNLNVPVATTATTLHSISIVGSRPERWTAKKPTPPRSMVLPFFGQDRKGSPSRAAKLAEATKNRRLLVLGPQSVLSPKKRGSAEKPEVRRASSFGLVSSDERRTVELDSDPAQMGNMLTPRPPGYGNQLAAAELITSGSSGSHDARKRAIKKRRRSTNRLKSHGLLMNRLISLQRADDADCVRLRSSVFPSTTNNQMLTLNDPRKTAKSTMDVTIASEPVPWNTEKELVSALGYVHAHVIAQDTGDDDADYNRKLSSTAHNFVTMYFTFETARQQKLRRGLQLRIYNVVVISNKRNQPHPNSSTRLDQYEVAVPVASVVCTRLCEPYPASLPALPRLPGLTDNAKADTTVGEEMPNSPWERNEEHSFQERFV